MTSRHRRRMFSVRRPKVETITTYGVDPVIHQRGDGWFSGNPATVLDNTREEMYPGGTALQGSIHGPSRDESGDSVYARRRECAPDDPYLSPHASEAIRALLVFINGTQAHNYTLDVAYDTDVDVQGFCVDAELTERQTAVICLTVDGWSQREIGAQLEISQKTVWEHLRTGRRRLIGRLPLLVGIRLAYPVTLEYNRGVETRPFAGALA
jgi:hypothetical protein